MRRVMQNKLSSSSLETISCAELSAATGGAKTGRMSQTARGAVYDHYFETGGGNQKMSIRTTGTTPDGWNYLVKQDGQAERGFVDKTGDVFPK
jgi:hypothetical protein